jgi:hypothetical protein
MIVTKCDRDACCQAEGPITAGQIFRNTVDHIGAMDDITLVRWIDENFKYDSSFHFLSSLATLLPSSICLRRKSLLLPASPVRHSIEEFE